jgi:acetate---CoA ligase (ADP-forming)
MMYLEGISDGRRLLELAGQGRKPIIAYKSNTSQASAHAAHSHTAALTNDDAIVSAAFKQFGIARAKTFREMGILAKGFHLPPVRGSRLAVFTRSGGHGIVATDLSAELKFDLPTYPESLIESAKKYFRADIIDVANPLDLGTVFDFDSYIPLVKECIEAIRLDAVLFIYAFRKDDLQTAIRITSGFQELSRETGLPIALYYSSTEENIHRLADHFDYPIFTEVYEAMQALAANRDFYHFQHETLPRRKQPSLVEKSRSGLAAKARKVLANHGSPAVLSSQALEICHIYGIPVAPWALALSSRDAIQQALRIGYPLALKLIAAEASHKSDIGGVILNIQNDGELHEAVERMQANALAHSITHGRFLLQKMAGAGREVILGAKRDDAFGPVILFGLGGIYVEALNDVAMRIAPIDKFEAREMIDEIKTSRILHGMRGQPPADLDGLADALVCLSHMIVDLPEIAEVDINPLIASEHGVVTVDARIMLLPAAAE